MKRVFVFVFTLSLTLSIISQPLLAQDELLYEEIIGAATLNTANLRDEASTANPSIGSLAAGTQVIILEEIPDGQEVSGNSLWYRIQLEDGSEAYIWSGALTATEVVSRRCLTILEPDSNDLWLINREMGDRGLREFDPENNTLHISGETGDIDLLWITSVTPDELADELGLTDQLPVEGYIDTESCRLVGTIVYHRNFRYYAVREAPGSAEINFIPEALFNGYYQADEETAAILSEGADAIFAAEQAVERVAMREALAPHRMFLWEEKIALVAVDEGSIQSDNPRGRERIFLLDMQGNLHRLTNNPDDPWQTESVWSEYGMAWSPDGTQVAFDFKAGRAHSYLIAFFNLEADAQYIPTQRQRSTAALWYPSWGPEGRRLVVINLVPTGMNAPVELAGLAIWDGESSIVTLTSEISLYPIWSPNGEYVGFISAEDTSAEDWYARAGIYVVDIDGENRRRIGEGESFHWSPDGEYLLIAKPDGIYTVDHNGENRQDLISDETITSFAIWSPDGASIAFSTEEGISVMDPDGGNRRIVTSEVAYRDICWSPDGTRLAFTTLLDDGSLQFKQLYTINIDGTGLTSMIDRFTTRHAGSLQPPADLVWLPAIPEP